MLIVMQTDFIQNRSMKLEHLDDISNGGKFKQIVSENLIRLYDFDESQTEALVQLISQTLLTDKQPLDLSTVSFIESVNCILILRLSSVDKGILRADQPHTFTCDLTEQSHMDTIEMMKAVSSGYNWLCRTSEENIDFLYSPGGTW